MKPDINRKFVMGLTQFLYLSILLSPFAPPVALLVIGVATILLYKQKWNFLGWPEGIFLGFMILSFVSWLFNPSWFYWIPIGIIPIALFGAYFLLTLWIRDIVKWTWQDVEKMYIHFWLGGLYVAAIVIIQQVDWAVLDSSWLGNILKFYNEFRWQSEHSVRSVGTAGNSNLAAAMLICFTLMSIYASSVLQKNWQKLVSFGALLLFCIAIWCTGSRGAWVGLVLGLIVQVWMTGHRKRTVALTLFLIILVSIYPQVIPRKDSLISTAEVRFSVWSNAFKVFQDYWLFGTLPLHFGQVFSEKAGFYVYHAHNVILGVASEFGVIGLALFTSLIFTTLRRARRWRKNANSKEEKRLAGMLISQVIALLGHGMYDYPIIAPQVGLMFFLSVIIIHTQYERRCLNRPEWSSPDTELNPRSLALSRASAIFLYTRNQLRSVFNHWIGAVKKRA
ncbi:O-antigen ligase family protein [Hazenella coriacea]|uniref:O-antigen ligase n=1 Tax=Hazenella coriacea TaxID=1179467 RepID=A0A4R3L1F3_9BACL|nr:O-antigen ligase family protein [Hazenella coriacea]TCS92795.1 O-antigen ligase [Hazenella coriacea]